MGLMSQHAERREQQEARWVPRAQRQWPLVDRRSITARDAPRIVPSMRAATHRTHAAIAEQSEGTIPTRRAETSNAQALFMGSAAIAHTMLIPTAVHQVPSTKHQPTLLTHHVGVTDAFPFPSESNHLEGHPPFLAPTSLPCALYCW
jgi:hypothetical protein